MQFFAPVAPNINISHIRYALLIVIDAMCFLSVDSTKKMGVFSELIFPFNPLYIIDISILLMYFSFAESSCQVKMWRQSKRFNNYRKGRRR